MLLTLATVGTVVRLHQLITDTALFAGMAIGLLGLVRVPDAPRGGGVLVGAGAAIAFLSKGLLGPGLLLCTAAARPEAGPAVTYWRRCCSCRSGWRRSVPPPDGRELYALVLVPALALLATGGLLRLSPRVEPRAAVLLATVLLLLCGVSLLIWAAAMFRPGFSARLPVVAAAPSMTPPSTPAMLAYAIVAALWLAILATQRRGRPRSLPLAGAAGLGLALGIDRAALERPAGRAEGLPHTGNGPQGTPARQLLCGQPRPRGRRACAAALLHRPADSAQESAPRPTTMSSAPRGGV